MKLKVIEKELDEDIRNALKALTLDGLNLAVVTAEQAIQQATDELEANERYQELKASIQVARSGLNAVRKRQKAIIAYALLVLSGNTGE